MTWIDFRAQFFESGCTNIRQIYAWYPGFQQSNLTRWIRQKRLLKLRNGYYTFPEYLDVSDFPTFLASQIRSPSYISLHSALEFYGLISENIPQITSIGGPKAAFFKNIFGNFSYRPIRPDLMFGYENHPVADRRVAPFATPEKAILDLLYLYPVYGDEKEMKGLNINSHLLQSELNISRLMSDLAKFENAALEKRVRLFRKIHGV